MSFDWLARLETFGETKRDLYKEERADIAVAVAWIWEARLVIEIARGDVPLVGECNCISCCLLRGETTEEKP